MALSLTVWRDIVNVNGVQANKVNPPTLNTSDYVDPVAGKGGSCTINCNGAAAATASDAGAGSPTSVAAVNPPTTELLHYWYGSSYRYRLRTNDGSTVGIRG
jgi:hypothetical protein